MITYHAAKHHHFDFGPVFLHDIKFLKSKLDNEIDLKIFMEKLDLYDEYREISEYIDNEEETDTFRIYYQSNLKLHKKIKPKGLRNLIFTKKGRSELLKIITIKFTHTEDL